MHAELTEKKRALRIIMNQKQSASSTEQPLVGTSPELENG
jgi:hypothetical protein